MAKINLRTPSKPLVMANARSATYNIAYYRVSSKDQSIEAQRKELRDSSGADFDLEFKDEGVSGLVPALSRVGFGLHLMRHLRAGDTLHVNAVDRLGRDAIDVQATVRKLTEMGVGVNVRGIGRLEGATATIVLAVLSSLAAIEVERLQARAKAGREKARESLAATGRTHKGAAGLGRPRGRIKGRDGGNVTVVPAEVVKWKTKNNASIAKTAAKFGISESTVKTYQRQAKAAEEAKTAPGGDRALATLRLADRP